jgi:hypothetical protein
VVVAPTVPLVIWRSSMMAALLHSYSEGSVACLCYSLALSLSPVHVLLRGGSLCGDDQIDRSCHPDLVCITPSHPCYLHLLPSQVEVVLLRLPYLHLPGPLLVIVCGTAGLA